MHRFDVGGQNDEYIVEVVVDPAYLEVDDTSFLRDAVLGKKSPLDDKIDRPTCQYVKHEQFPSRYRVEKGNQLGLEVFLEKSGLENPLLPRLSFHVER